MGKIIQNGIEYGKSYSEGTLIGIDNDTISVKMRLSTPEQAQGESSTYRETLVYTEGPPNRLYSMQFELDVAKWKDGFQAVSLVELDNPSHVVVNPVSDKTDNYDICLDCRVRLYEITPNENAVFTYRTKPNKTVYVELICWD